MSSIEKRPSTTRQRKSTLTQQQKNKKRQRATPQQLSVLRSEFIINSTPNAKTREEIGKKIDMTERSVQIWFQNKRAKAKQFTRRHSNGFHNNGQFNGNFYPHTPIISPISSPHMHAAAAVAAAQKGFLSSANMVTFNSNIPNGMLAVQSPQPTLALKPGDVMLPCSSVTIGSWRRVSSKVAVSSDLHVIFSALESTLTYTMFADYTGFRISISMNDIKNIHYSPTQGITSTGELYIHLLKCPSFAIQTPKSVGTWGPCDDFSEMMQASYVMLHKLVGPAFQLQMQLAQVAQSFPQLVSGIDISKFQNNQMVSPFLEVPTSLGVGFPGIKDTGQDAGLVVSKLGKAQSPTDVTADLDSFGVLNGVVGAAGDKPHDSSVPLIASHDENSLLPDSSIDDDLLYNIDKSLFTPDVDDPGELDFTSSLFGTHKDWELNPSISIGTIASSSLESAASSSPGYLTSALDADHRPSSDLFHDEFIKFPVSATAPSSVSSASACVSMSSNPLSATFSSASTNDTEFEFNPATLDTDKLLITTSANLAGIEGTEFFLDDALTAEAVAGVTGSGSGTAKKEDGSSSSSGGLDSAIDPFSTDISLLALIA